MNFIRIEDTTPLIVNSRNPNVYLIFENKWLDIDLLTYCEKLRFQDYFGKLLLVCKKTSTDEIFNSQLQVLDVISCKTRIKIYQYIIKSIASIKLN